MNIEQEKQQAADRTARNRRRPNDRTQPNHLKPNVPSTRINNGIFLKMVLLLPLLNFAGWRPCGWLALVTVPFLYDAGCRLATMCMVRKLPCPVGFASLRRCGHFYYCFRQWAYSTVWSQRASSMTTQQTITCLMSSTSSTGAFPSTPPSILMSKIKRLVVA